MRVVPRRHVGRFGPHERGVSMSGVYDELTDAEDYMSNQLRCTTCDGSEDVSVFRFGFVGEIRRSRRDLRVLPTTG
jgi:hypothetical protein